MLVTCPHCDGISNRDSGRNVFFCENCERIFEISTPVPVNENGLMPLFEEIVTNEMERAVFLKKGMLEVMCDDCDEYHYVPRGTTSFVCYDCGCHITLNASNTFRFTMSDYDIIVNDKDVMDLKDEIIKEQYAEITLLEADINNRNQAVMLLREEMADHINEINRLKLHAEQLYAQAMRFKMGIVASEESKEALKTHEEFMKNLHV